MIKLHKELKVIPLGSIKPAELNANELTDVEYEKLKDDIMKNGFVDPVKVRKNGKGYILVDGHHRYKAMQELGQSDITAIIIDNDEKQAHINAIRFNTERGHSNQKKLAEIIKSLQEKGMSLGEIEHQLIYDGYEIQDALSLLDLPDDLEEILKQARDKEEEDLPVIYSFVVRNKDKDIIDEAFKIFGDRGAGLVKLCKTVKEQKQQ